MHFLRGVSLKKLLLQHADFELLSEMPRFRAVEYFLKCLDFEHDFFTENFWFLYIFLKIQLIPFKYGT